MKKYLLLLLPVVLFAACIKDRIAPAAPPVVVSATDTLMYYWDFNDADSSVHTPTFGVTANGWFDYHCAYIDFTDGTSLNAVGANDSGQCLRVRNPSDSILFVMPTTGYDSVVFQYAVRPSSTSSGCTNHLILYTTDGSNYISTALANNSYVMTDTTFEMHSFDFSADPNVNNNPKFAVKIVFNNNNTGTKGNDRFDNISLSGIRK